MSDLSIGHSHPIMCEDTLSCLSYVVTPYHVITIMSTDNDDLWLSHVMAYKPMTMTTRPSVEYTLPTYQVRFLMVAEQSNDLQRRT